MANVVIQRDYYHPVYPKQPCHNSECSINLMYKTLPEFTNSGKPWPWSYSAAAPTSMKHIYTGIPNYFPHQMISKPVGTMYESEFQQTGEIYDKRLSYHWKAYPFTHKHIREKPMYAPYILPAMSVRDWTKYPVIRETKLDSWS